MERPQGAALVTALVIRRRCALWLLLEIVVKSKRSRPRIKRRIPAVVFASALGFGRLITTSKAIGTRRLTRRGSVVARRPTRIAGATRAKEEKEKERVTKERVKEKGAICTRCKEDTKHGVRRIGIKEIGTRKDSRVKARRIRV